MGGAHPSTRSTDHAEFRVSYVAGGHFDTKTYDVAGYHGDGLFFLYV